jgi:hypothetical protein
MDWGATIHYRGAYQMPHLRLRSNLLHVLKFFVLCRCGVPVILYMHIHSSGNALFDNA